MSSKDTSFHKTEGRTHVLWRGLNLPVIVTFVCPRDCDRMGGAADVSYLLISTSCF